MTEAQAQAKQLDSVTDRFEEQEVDSAKALQAIYALSTPASGAASNEAELAVVVNKADVELICNELEVTEELAIQTLRQVAVQDKNENMVKAALRKLVRSG